MFSDDNPEVITIEGNEPARFILQNYHHTEYINIHVWDIFRGVIYRMRPMVPFRSMMQEWRERTGNTWAQFSYQGSRVNEFDTPDSVRVLPLMLYTS